MCFYFISWRTHHCMLSGCLCILPPISCAWFDPKTPTSESKNEWKGLKKHKHFLNIKLLNSKLSNKSDNSWWTQLIVDHVCCDAQETNYSSPCEVNWWLRGKYLEFKFTHQKMSVKLWGNNVGKWFHVHFIKENIIPLPSVQSMTIIVL